MPPDAFSLSFKNGLRAIVVGIPNESFNVSGPSRKYIGIRLDGLPPWFKDSWSVCQAPTDQEAEFINKTNDLGPGVRLDAVCKITPDGQPIVTGYIYSAPKL